MTYPVEFRMDGKALFPVRINGMTLTAPDTFRPEVGDQMYADHVKETALGELEQIANMNLFVTGVEWRLRMAGGLTSQAQAQYELVMRVTLSSEVPSARTSRRVHVDKK